MHTLEVWNAAQDAINSAAGEDAYYQETLRECREAEAKYLEVVGRLTPEEREVIDDYVTVCENLEFQRARIAYFLPKS